MELAECLEERVKHNTIYPDCVACRAVFYIWDEKDKIANDFCIELGKRKNGQAEPIAVKNVEEASQMLEERWKSCTEKMDTREVMYQKGMYVLAIGTSLEIVEHIKLPGGGTMELAVLMADGNLKEPVDGELDNLYTRWKINRTDVGAAALLLLHAAYDDCLIKQKVGGGYVFGLKYDEYNIVREEMCNHYLAILNRQLSKSQYDQEMVEEKLSIEKNIKKIQGRWMKPEWIPITGYEELVKGLKGRYGKTAWRRWILKVTKNDMQTDWTIEKALSILVGMAEGELKTEWLRNIVRTRELPVLCSEIIEQDKDKILSIINANFSYHDICNSLPQKLMRYVQNLNQNIATIEKNIEIVLQKNFVFKSFEVIDVLEGMNSYYSLWNEYMKLCAKKEYLSGIITLVKEKSEITIKNYQELKKAENILKNSKSNIREPQMELAEDTFGVEQIDNKESLIRAMEKFNSFLEFKQGDVSEIKNMADIIYQSKEDYDVDEKRHPQFYLIFNKELTEKENENQHYFKWADYPVNYISKSIIGQLRIYRYPE